MFGRMSNREMRNNLRSLEQRCNYLMELHWELNEKHHRLVDYLNVVEHKEKVHEYRKKGGPEQA